MAKILEKIFKKPKAGEKTRIQNITSGISGVATALTGMDGYTPASPGTYETYRKIRQHPTVALARTIASVPIRMATWSIEATDDVQEDRVDFIREQVENFWPSLIYNIPYSLDYGFQSFEKVWDIDNGKFGYAKIKPLLPDYTEVRVDEKTGAFAGLKQNAVELGPEKVFWFTYDGEAGNFYGRSRHENIRVNAWQPWLDTAQQMANYGAKTAGVIPVVEYPTGESKDATGAVKSNFDLAKMVIEKLSSAKGIAMPNQFKKYAEDLIQKGVSLKDMQAWVITFLEPKGQHGSDFVNMLKYYDSQLMRGWLVPERAAIEGTFGTKAEAETHGDLAIEVAILLYNDILRYVNWYLINPLLRYNFGQDAENTVYISKAGITAEQQAFLRELLGKTLTNPANIDLLVSWLDIDSMLDSVGLPKAEETINTDDMPARPGDDKDDAASMTRLVRNIYRETNASIKKIP